MRGSVIERFASWDAFLAVLTAATLTYAAIAVPIFVTAFNISQAIAGVSERALIVLPMVLLIIAREIDLSVASMLALSSVVFGVAVQAGTGISIAIFAALLTGLAGGTFNGVLVTLLGLPSLVVTLGTLALFRGVGYIILGSGSVNEFPDAFTDFGIDTVKGSVLPWTIVPFLILAPIFAVLLQKSAIGRRIYAIGGNPDVARYAGVRVGRIRLALFATSGVIAALAGVVFSARLANARADNAVGLELDVITIALLGGVSVFGGRGHLTGVFFALVLIAALRNILGLLQIGGDAQGTVIGLLLIGSLLLSSVTQRLFASASAFLASPDSRRLQTGRSAGGQIQPDHRRLDGENGGDDNMRASYIIAALFVGTAVATSSCLAADPVTVGFLPKLDTDPYFQVAKTGAEEAQKEIGGKVVQEAPSQATAEAQIPFINTLVSQKVGVIAIAGNDANAVAPALKRAAQQGVIVVSYDFDVAPSARTLFFNQAKGDSLAEMMIESMGQMIGYEGEFAILSSTPTATNQNAWVAFMKEKLKDPKFAKMKLVQVAYGQESEQVNQQQALALVQAFPNLKGIIIPAGIGLPAAARALEQAGSLGKVKLTGLAPATLIKKYIQNGSVQDIWWNVKDLGYLTYYGSEALAEGKITGKEGDKFTAGRLGEYTIGAKGEVVLGPAQIVTPANVDEFKF